MVNSGLVWLPVSLNSVSPNDLAEFVAREQHSVDGRGGTMVGVVEVGMVRSGSPGVARPSITVVHPPTTADTPTAVRRRAVHPPGGAGCVQAHPQ